MNTESSLIQQGIRPLHIRTDFINQVPSALIVQGKTQVLCTATYEDKVPPFLKDKKQGWLKSEYSMLPTAGGLRRQPRERNHYHSRNLEIERFIGRALRTVINMKTFGYRTITIDCDVLQADGGTRCASVIGGVVALHQLFKHMVFEHIIPDSPPMKIISAISAGIKDDQVILDMDYNQDADADADINIVSDENGCLIEATTFVEGKPICMDQYIEALNRALQINSSIIKHIKKITGR